MAELPRYRRMGIQYADLPRIGELTTTGYDVAARGAGSLASKLDQLQEYFYRKSVQETEESARRYAAQNPVTQEQIDAAKNPKSDLQALLAGEGGPIYRRALLEAQGSVLAEQLKIDGARKIADLMAAAETGQIDSWQVQNEVIDMIDGFTATVGAFDPESAIRLRADLSTRGNTAIKNTMAEEAKRAQMLIGSKFEEQLQTDQVYLEDIFKNPELVDPSTGEVISIDDRVEQLRQTYYSSVEMTGEDNYLKEFNKRVNETRIDAIAKAATNVDYFDTPLNAYTRMKADDLGAYQVVWDQMTQDDKDATMKRVIDRVSMEKRLQDDNAKVKKGELIAEAQTLVLSMYDPQVSPAQRDAGIKRLIEINAEAESSVTSTAELKSIKNGRTDDNSADDKVIFAYEALIDSGRIVSSNQIDSIAEDGNISWKQARALNNRLNAVENKRLQDALRTFEANVTAGVPVYMQPKIKNDIAVGKSEIVDEVRANPDADPAEIARRKAEEQTKAAEDKAKENDYNRIVDVLRIAVPDFQDHEDLANKMIENPSLLDTVVEDKGYAAQIRSRLKRLTK